MKYVSRANLLINKIRRNSPLLAAGILVLFLFVPLLTRCFAASTTAGTIERSRELLEQDKRLRQTIEQEGKFFVETIIVKGASKLSEQEIKETIAPFQQQWMAKEAFQQLIDALKSAYRQKGIGPEQVKLFYELKKGGILEITVKE